MNFEDLLPQAVVEADSGSCRKGLDKFTENKPITGMAGPSSTLNTATEARKAKGNLERR